MKRTQLTEAVNVMTKPETKSKLFVLSLIHETTVSALARQAIIYFVEAHSKEIDQFIKEHHDEFLKPEKICADQRQNSSDVQASGNA